MRYVLTFLLIFGTLSAEEIEKSISLSDLEYGLPHIVAGCVNAITGHYVEREQDIFLPAPVPLSFSRSYSSGDLHSHGISSAWHHDHECFVKIYNFNGVPTLYYLGERGGRACDYKEKYRQHYKKFVPHKSYPGLTNYPFRQICAKTHIKNNAFYIYNGHEDKAKAYFAHGGKGYYLRYSNSAAGDFYVLQEELLANGNKFLYNYQNKNQLKDIKTTDATGSVTFAALTCTKDQGKYEVRSHDGRYVSYILENYQDKNNSYQRIKEVHRTDGPSVTYEYNTNINLPQEFITARFLPNGRKRFIGYYISSREKKNKKVRTIQSPVGENNTPITTHTFIYHEGHKIEEGKEKIKVDGYTEVIDAKGHQTYYAYDQNKRLTAVLKTKADHKIPSEEALYPHVERFIWNKSGELLCQRIDHHLENTLISKTFNYDDAGNKTRETLFGNLSGKEKKVTNDDEGLPVIDKCEHYSKSFVYSQDRLHNLLKEEEDNGKSITYTYYPGTDLLASKLEKDHGIIKLRHFYFYDSYHILIKTITDNGNSPTCDLSGVTERKITSITPRYSTPFGLPEIIQESYLDSEMQQEKQLIKKVLHYSLQGYLLKQDVYDSEDTYRYSLQWEYNDHGKVIKEINPLGQEIYRSYDDNDNLVYEQGPRHDYYRKYHYDFSNRLIKEEIVLENQQSLTTHHIYDHLSNETATIDYNGNAIKHEYDNWGRRVKTILLPIPNHEHQLIVTEMNFKYDIFGNMIAFSNQRNEVTKTKYNILGKPTHIISPEKTEEKFIYNLDGTLKKATAKNGMVTLYTYDSFKRVIKEEHFAPEEKQPLDQIEHQYNGFHLLSSTDAEGITTYYSYDGASRLIRVVKEDAKECYEYDQLGRLHKTISWYGDQPDAYRVKVQEHDLLDRLIEERIEDALGGILEKVNYAYDADGNCIQEKRFTQEGSLKTRKEYNPLGQPTKIIDAEGNVTTFIYTWGQKDIYGMNVSQITEIDPMGTQTITTMNAQNKEGMIIKKSAFGKILSKKELFYDGIGNLQVLAETIITPGKEDKTTYTHWLYNSENQLLKSVFAMDSPEERSTLYRYNKRGQVEAIQQSNGTTLFHTYDEKGRLQSHFASDNSFHYSYEYNLNDMPIKIQDHIHNTCTERVYDVLSRIIEETLGNGHKMSYTYDRLGRCQKVHLPNESQIKYSYDGLHLKEVLRLSPTGEPLYAHHYSTYDLSGHLLLAKLPGLSGDLHFRYDLLGRLTHIGHPKWTQTVPEQGYDPNGNLTAFTLQDHKGKITCSFTYDELNQLTSETGIANHHYLFDSVNNRTQQDENEYRYNLLNQIVSDTEKYDFNGNLIQSEDAAYAYDAQGRLICVTKNQEKYTYIYDAFNRRLEKKHFFLSEGHFELQDTWHYIYHDQNEIGCLNPETQEIIELRVLGNGKGAEIGASVAIELKDKIYVPIHNLTGSIAALIDIEAAEQVASYRYSAFGEMDEEAPLIPWTFLGKRLDPETQFIYFGRRYYFPKFGKWITPDPSGFTDGPNLYAFVKNNPLIYFDHFGLTTEETSYHDIFFSYPQNFEEITLHPDMLKAHAINMAFHAYEGFFSQYNINQPCILSLGRPELPSGSEILHVNGMRTSFADVVSNMLNISDKAQGYNVRAIFSPTMGFISDLNRVSRELIWKENSTAVHLINGYFDKFLNEKPRSANILLMSHSEGTVIANNAIKHYPHANEIKDQLSMLLFNFAKCTDPSRAKFVAHYASIRDPIAQIIGRCTINANNKHTVNFLKPHQNAPLFDHGFQSPTNDLVIRTQLNRFLKKYEGI